MSDSPAPERNPKLAVGAQPGSTGDGRWLREVTELVQDPEALDVRRAPPPRGRRWRPRPHRLPHLDERRIHSHQQRWRREPLAPREGPTLSPTPSTTSSWHSRSIRSRSRQPASRRRQRPASSRSTKTATTTSSPPTYDVSHKRLHDPLSPEPPAEQPSKALKSSQAVIGGSHPLRRLLPHPATRPRAAAPEASSVRRRPRTVVGQCGSCEREAVAVW